MFFRHRRRLVLMLDPLPGFVQTTTIHGIRPGSGETAHRRRRWRRPLRAPPSSQSGFADAIRNHGWIRRIHLDWAPEPLPRSRRTHHRRALTHRVRTRPCTDGSASARRRRSGLSAATLAACRLAVSNFERGRGRMPRGWTQHRPSRRIAPTASTCCGQCATCGTCGTRETRDAGCLRHTHAVLGAHRRCPRPGRRAVRWVRLPETPQSNANPTTHIFVRAHT